MITASSPAHHIIISLSLSSITIIITLLTPPNEMHKYQHLHHIITTALLLYHHHFHHNQQTTPIISPTTSRHHYHYHDKHTIVINQLTFTITPLPYYHHPNVTIAITSLSCHPTIKIITSLFITSQSHNHEHLYYHSPLFSS